MIAEGAHLLAVKERLGHSTIHVTADRYGHLFPSLEASLTDRLDRTYAAAVAKHQHATGSDPENDSRPEPKTGSDLLLLEWSEPASIR